MPTGSPNFGQILEEYDGKVNLEEHIQDLGWTLKTFRAWVRGNYDLYEVAAEKSPAPRREVFLEVLERELSHQEACSESGLSFEAAMKELAKGDSFLARYQSLVGGHDPHITWVGWLALDIHLKGVKEGKHQSAVALLKAYVDRFRTKSARAAASGGGSRGRVATDPARIKKANRMYDKLLLKDREGEAVN